MAPSRIPSLILFLATSVAHADDSLGRLFLTVEQRQELDAQRDPNAPQTDAGPAGPGTAAAGAVVLNGIVRRSGGSDVVWVNGVRTSAATGQSVHLQRGPDQSNRVTLKNADGAVARLKPGQFWNPATGRVAECLGCTAVPGTTAPAPLPDSPTTSAPAAGPVVEPQPKAPAETSPAPAPVTTPATLPKSAVAPPAVASASSPP